MLLYYAVKPQCSLGADISAMRPCNSSECALCTAISGIFDIEMCCTSFSCYLTMSLLTTH